MDNELMPSAASENIPFYRKKWVMISIGLVTLGLLSACIMSYLKSRSYTYTDDAIVDGQKISVSSECAGRIVKMAATEGLAVRKDDLLVELDSAEINAEKAKAEAALLSSDANIKLCEISLGKANSDLKRSRSLYKSGAISLAQYEQAEKDFSNMTIQKQMADIQVQSSKAQLELIEAQTQFRRIYSPDDGVIAKKWVSEGDVVQPGQVLYSIYNLKKVTVLANMEETSIRKVRIGQAAEVAIDAYPGRKYSGKVISIFPCTASQMVPMQTINATGDFTKLTQYVSLRVSLDETPSNDISSRFPVLPGMSVEVWVKGD